MQKKTCTQLQIFNENLIFIEKVGKEYSFQIFRLETKHRQYPKTFMRMHP